ncbi:decarboxylase [Defluviimonas sp. WL0075]|uniref:Decarboxylase n=1 Tax=Albidovulum sediminicola TaxID=2984331 RepID=A0ABT2Z5D7_9RHOB|nr:decarboxylase [Defluviimonas sp. WL0075]MCV2866367.1 decarboxylase [Defluviimonas sp. WL0075]
MVASPSIAPLASTVAHPAGAKIIAGIKSAGVREIIALPDIVTSDGLLWPISRDPDFRLTRICKEDEGVSICAAMSYNGTRAVLIMQQTGLMDSLNAIRAIGMDYKLPVVMMVGLQGKEPHLGPEQSAVYGVRIIRPVLDAMQLSHSLIEDPEDVDHIQEAIVAAYATSRPHVFLIGRAPEAP